MGSWDRVRVGGWGGIKRMEFGSFWVGIACRSWAFWTYTHVAPCIAVSFSAAGSDFSLPFFFFF